MSTRTPRRDRQWCPKISGPTREYLLPEFSLLDSRTLGTVNPFPRGNPVPGVLLSQGHRPKDYGGLRGSGVDCGSPVESGVDYGSPVENTIPVPRFMRDPKSNKINLTCFGPISVYLSTRDPYPDSHLTTLDTGTTPDPSTPVPTSFLHVGSSTRLTRPEVVGGDPLPRSVWRLPYTRGSVREGASWVRLGLKDLQPPPRPRECPL